MRVLQSFPAGRRTTNPYLVQLSDRLGPDPEVWGFTWWRALTGQYDVLHAHWPEALLHGTTPARSLARRWLFRALVLRLRLNRRRTALVRTVHNLRSHETGPRVERRLLERFDRATTLWIRLNPTTPVPRDAPVATIEHGDYRDWFDQLDVPVMVPGRLVFFGLIRPYKAVPGLIEAFSALPAGPHGDALSLRVVGRPSSADIGAEVSLAARSDERVQLSLGHAEDAELAAEIGQAELVVLPYREMHNSGAAVLALSLARPILVPGNSVTDALRREVGTGWVYTYSGALTPDVLRQTLARLRAERSPDATVAAQPNLSGRAWPVVAAAHREAYARAVRVARAPRAAATVPAWAGSGTVEQPPVGGEATVDAGQVGQHGSPTAVAPESRG